MPETWTDERLALVLASVGDHLETSCRRRSGPSTGPDRRRNGWVLAAAAALVAVALVAGALVAPVREAVADWLGIGSTGIERVPDGDARGDPSGLPSLAEDLPAVSADEAEEELGRPLPDVAAVDGLGPPDRIVRAPEGGVILAWDRAETTLWVHEVDGDAPSHLGKIASRLVHVEAVAGLGEAALSLEGDHVLTTPDRRVAAANVVIWIEDGFEHRLESRLDVQEIVGMARSIER